MPAAATEEISAEVAALIKGGPDVSESPAKPDTDVAQATPKQGDEAKAAESGDGTESEAKEQAKPQAGTPDKTLQKMQQDLSSALRLVQGLHDKKASGEELSDKEQQKLDRGVARLASIQQYLESSGKGDPFDAMPALAEELLDLRKKVTQNSELREEIDELKELLEETSSTASWSKAETKYAGTDVKGIWKKAVEDAAETIGDDDSEKLYRLANKFFHERAAGAATRKSTTAATETEKTKQAATTLTKGGAQVTTNVTAAGKGEPSADAQYDSMVMALIKRDD